jgi:signal transduction histidine kinase
MMVRPLQPLPAGTEAPDGASSGETGNDLTLGSPSDLVDPPSLGTNGQGIGSEPSDSELVSVPLAFQAQELCERIAELEVRLDVAESERCHARSVLATLPHPVIVTDPFEEVVLVSVAAARLFNFPAGQTRPEDRQDTDALQRLGPLSEIWPDEELLTAVAEVRALHRRGARRVLRRTLSTPMGDLPFDITLICVCDQTDGKPSPWGVVMVLSEVSRTTLNRQAEIATAQAEITASIAHELRTPLTAIRAYTELLLDNAAGSAGKGAPAQRDHFLQVIAAEADRLARLVDNMHMLARIEAGQAKPRRVPLDPGQVIRAALAVVAPQAISRHVHLLPADLPTTPLPKVAGDPDLLQQALLNTLGNAIKYTPAKGTVRIAASLAEPPADHCLDIVIEDSGVGIEPRDLPFVFEKFFRSRAIASTAPGSGLGMPLVKAIIESVHAGMVQVESTPGSGTRVLMRLPVIN